MDDALETRSERLRDDLRRPPVRRPKVVNDNQRYTVRLTPSPGIIVHRTVVPAMGDAAGIRLPQVAFDVYVAPTVVLLGLGGLVIALAGALPPAAWAARIRTTTALRAE
jgi:hypothetical protein